VAAVGIANPSLGHTWRVEAFSTRGNTNATGNPKIGLTLSQEWARAPSYFVERLRPVGGAAAAQTAAIPEFHAAILG